MLPVRVDAELSAILGDIQLARNTGVPALHRPRPPTLEVTGAGCAWLLRWASMEHALMQSTGTPKDEAAKNPSSTFVDPTTHMGGEENETHIHMQQDGRDCGAKEGPRLTPSGPLTPPEQGIMHGGRGAAGAGGQRGKHVVRRVIPQRVGFPGLGEEGTEGARGNTRANDPANQMEQPHVPLASGVLLEPLHHVPLGNAHPICIKGRLGTSVKCICSRWGGFFGFF
eukprot:CAMPEP_0174344628 /NCGR_PEP_ID=MMETSP0810-20121108/27778_1 /TAXON_ID=73025 ORGANISM="Eutreptiella gymnastica-like, Strain CCMP1594" /NCGR_SAMPLE_ID=MMETSP0810 /ASSEMBLY_ACC=CAM_ASM_000659 /LENGTH=225 /DNA_ID=CAMNT_0015467807 /DNA_START=1807 /DNA_END=2488 /DNA_ORIENTATION=+